ncbi:glycosyltransferase family 4 protein [bacterium]|nr:glycosyltransferase family 4 protein [bacterium]
MKIAMLSWETLHSISVGGIAPHVTEQAVALTRSGHEVHVITRIAPGQQLYSLIEGVHYHRCPYPGLDDFVDEINNMCRIFVDKAFEIEDSSDEPFDIVHAHDWLTANAMIWIKQGRGRRSIITIHSTEYGRCGNSFPGGQSNRVREQERAGTYWADRVICVSYALKNEIKWMYEVPDDKISVIYNGVSAQRFDADVDPGAVRANYDIGPMDPMVLFCGRLEWQKGPDILIEAIPSILKHYGNAKFVFAGAGSMLPDLKRRAGELGIDSAVRFLGVIGGVELPALFKSCDCVCVPSRNEPFGIVILEAWSAGKPVVATDVGGPNEFVTHEENGFKVSPNPDSVAWGLGTLLSDFDKARWMGENGHRVVHENYSWDIIVRHTIDAYDTPRLQVPTVIEEPAPNPIKASAAAMGRQGRPTPPAKEPSRTSRRGKAS